MNALYIVLEKLWFIIPAVIIAAVYSMIRVKKSTAIDKGREILLLLFRIYLIGLAAVTIIPNWTIDASGFRLIGLVHSGGGRFGFFSKINLLPFNQIVETFDLAFHQGFGRMYFILNVFGNIALFMPMGFALPFLWNISAGRTVLYCFLASFFIEAAQLPFIRGTDIDDVILNVIGSILGYLLYILYKRLRNACKCGISTNLS